MAQKLSRSTYAGADATKPMRVKSISFKHDSEKEMPKCTLVPNLSYYESGCREHRDCFGHMCVTPNGILLPPQSMSMRNGDIVTEYLKASKAAFEGNKEAYLESIHRTNYTKYGTMRSMMSMPISGSGRLIATPQWEYGRDIVCISANLASKLRVCRIATEDDGVKQSVYSEVSLQEGDYVIVVRPPSLSIRNTQPMKVAFWPYDCIGIHPESFSAFHGDFDGDEAHLYPVYNADSIAECESWVIPQMTTFEKGRKLYNSLVNNDPVLKCDEHMCKFLENTTLSAAQMKSSVPKLAFGNYSRNKDEHITGMHERFNNANTEISFIEQSVRGMADVSRQQLSQSSIGDMTRVAKVVAMCFYRPQSGGLYVCSSTGPKLICNDGVSDSGNACLRAVMSMCAVAQQAALDAHRVQVTESASFDFISNMFLGRTLGAKPEYDSLTLVAFRKDIPDKVLDGVNCTWKYSTSDHVVTLCRPIAVARFATQYITGAYNPKILALFNKSKIRQLSICKQGVTIVCNYYNVPMSIVELNDISHMFVYNVESSYLPITCREGVLKRSISWIETLLATDFTKINQLTSINELPETSTSAMMTSNFSHLTTRQDSE